MNEQTNLPAELQLKQATVNQNKAAARQSTQAAEKAQNELNREIREYFTK